MKSYEVFVFSMEEYIKLTQSLEKTKYDENEMDQQYALLVFKAMLIRKYIANDRESVYLPNVIGDLNEDYPHLKEDLNAINDRFSKLFNSEIRHRLTDETELTHIDTIFDILYGLYMHADVERILNLSKTDNQLLNQLLADFIYELEIILNELLAYIVKSDLNKIKVVSQIKSREKAPIISYENIGERKISNSPYWSNFSGRDIDSEEYDFYEYFNDEEKEMHFKAFSFFSLLIEEELNYEELKKLVLFSSLPYWGNFKNVSEFFKGLENVALSNIIRYSEDMREAFIYYVPNVEGAFEVIGRHATTDIIILKFKRALFRKEYKIHSIIDTLPENYRSRID